MKRVYIKYSSLEYYQLKLKELFTALKISAKFFMIPRIPKLVRPTYNNPWIVPSIGKHVYLANTMLDCANQITIEDYVFFGHDVLLLTSGHDYQKRLKERQRIITSKPILIKKGAWIGSRAVILGGVVIGEHAVIGAGSVVTHNIPPSMLYAGVPAKPIKSLK